MLFTLYGFISYILDMVLLQCVPLGHIAPQILLGWVLACILGCRECAYVSLYQTQTASSYAHCLTGLRAQALGCLTTAIEHQLTKKICWFIINHFAL